MTTLLEELLARYQVLPEEAKNELRMAAIEGTAAMRWIPNPGPQTEAYHSLADVLLYGGEPGGGKLLSMDTLIPTPFGWTTMGEIAVGDLVIDAAGLPCQVVAKSNIEIEPTYRVEFSDGSHVVAGARHQWVTSTRLERLRRLRNTDEWRSQRRAERPSRGVGKRPDLAARNRDTAAGKNLPTQDIRTTQQIAETLQGQGGRFNHAISVCGALQLPHADLLVDPYTLGAWLGDGTSSSAGITGIDEEVFEQVAAGGYTISRYANVKTCGVIGLQSQLRKLGILGNKHIPAAYLRASTEQRLALLQGLMDTDGHCDSRGQCEIQLTRKVLVDGVLELLLSLGIKVQMREGVAKLYGRTIGPKWRLKFLTEHKAFRLSRKLVGQKRAGFRGTHDVRYVVAATPVDPVPMQCIQVDSPSRTYLCGRSFIPTHNSQLLLGLAFNCHQRSLLMRRQYGDLERLIDDALKINGGREGFNGSPPPRLRLGDDRVINFRAAQRVGDEQGTMGQGRDFLGIDEATHFSESQIRFLMGWVRTEKEGQRCRTVLATNPPLTAEGLWVNSMFAPWLDPNHPQPAKPGELRWVISDEEGKDEWVDGPDVRLVIRGKEVKPTSRTYIPASVKDNPYYAATDYERQLDAMPEPFRSQLLGGFRTQFKDDDFQVLPTAWIEAAQKRWKPDGHSLFAMTAMAIDPAGGGRDEQVIATRFGGWYAPLEVEKGPTTADPGRAFGFIMAARRDNCAVVVDVGGGYGGPISLRLKDNKIEHVSFNGAGSSNRRAKGSNIPYGNKRAEAWFAFREALDPNQQGGSPICLPDDPELKADLAAVRYDAHALQVRGVYQIENKDDLRKRLGRSPGKGDAVVMCLSAGLAAIKRAARGMNRMPQVNLGYQSRKRHVRMLSN